MHEEETLQRFHLLRYLPSMWTLEPCKAHLVTPPLPTAFPRLLALMSPLLPLVSSLEP
jgi:hypothetical protein